MQVEVVLIGRDAEHFFTGLPPFDPHGAGSSAATGRLDARLAWLTTPPPLPSSRPQWGEDAAPQPGSGAGCRWLDCCVKLAFLVRPAAAAAAEGGTWQMPCIRLVQTAGRGPPPGS